MSAILITGSDGQLGRALEATYKTHFMLLPFFYGKKKLDITDPNQIASCIQSNNIHYIINCAAYTNVDRAEHEIEACFNVNSTAVGHLALLSAKYNVVLIHISTDYVFGTTTGKPLQPNDPTKPLNQYGRSKLAGEKLIAACASRFYIIRTSWLYGAHGNNFFTKVVKKAKQGINMQMVDDQIGSPTYVYDLATTIWKIIESIERYNPNCYPAGIYHYTNEGIASWYDFAYAILAAFPNPSTLTPRSSLPSAIQRPHYSVLNKSSFKEVFQIKIPHWKHSLATCCKEWRILYCP